ncbi:MAG: 6-phosphogluconolactonase [Verrucomicrobiota bacterium]|nr:6-phosphogluconolactonase [Verrucomicrobiota bacterium]
MRPFEIRKAHSPQALAATVAEQFVGFLARNPGRPLTVALSGGRITKLLFEQIVAIGKQKRASFDHVHFFWADERCVRPDDPESNYRIANDLLFKPLEIPSSQIHRIRGEIDPKMACQEIEGEICRIAPLTESGQPIIDLVFLGMGEDGHVASLFPNESEAVRDLPDVYREVIGPKPPPRRITLGYQALAAALNAWVLASGTGKETAFNASTIPNGQTPLARVLESRMETIIYSDIPD